MYHSKHEPLYGWALNQQGQPIPISAAVKGEIYRCPVCHGDMVAKLGEVKQHHFAHVSLLQCSPENVARAVAGTWLADELRRYLARGETLTITWQTEDGREKHTLNILQGVTQILQDHTLEYGVGDIVLLDAAGKAKIMIALGLGDKPLQPQPWLEANTVVIKLNPASLKTGELGLQTLLTQSQIWGGWLLMDANNLPEGVIRSAEGIKAALIGVLNRPPFLFYGELVTENGLAHLLHINGQKLWLPLEVWEQAIGGSRNKLASNVQLIIKEELESAVSKVEFVYIMAGETAAVLVRRFPANETVVMKLDNSHFRLNQVKALELAKQLAGVSMELPR